MMKIVLLDSFYPINSRNVKIVSSLKRDFPNACVDVITWNRENRNISVEHNNYIIYHQFSPSGHLYRKLINLYGYYRFVKKYISKYDIVIASHWDMLMIASYLKKKNQLLIYENLDIPTSYNSFILRVLQIIEKISLRNCNAIVFASRFFEPLYTYCSATKFIIENKSYVKPQFSVEHKEKVYSKRPFVLSYIGLVRYLDIMKNLVLSVANMPGVKLRIHGDGPDLLELKNFAKKYDNIEFTGRYEQKDIPALYYNSDLVWAAYPNKDYNVKYAISNKFHESIDYHTPCIYANNTKLGDLVTSRAIGVVVDPYNIVSIRSVINNIVDNPKQLGIFCSNLIIYAKTESTWNDQFSILSEYIESYERSR